MFDSASELVDRLLKDEVKPQKIMEKCLRKIEESEDKLNAFITLNENAVDEAKELEGKDKPLGGMPIAVKDNVETKGMRTTYGSKFFEDNVPNQDAVIVERLKKAGSVVIGKTNLPELALIAYTDNPLIGETHNPWDLERTVGGSSGGSAAAVAAGDVPAAIGSDGGGSIRIPASFCHLYGLKPSFGRVPSYPKMPIFMGLHSEGFLTRTVEDTAMLLDLTKGRDSRDIDSLPYDGEYKKAVEGEVGNMKIAFSPDLGYATVEPTVEEIVRESAFNLEEFGTVEEVDIQIPNLEKELISKVVLEATSLLGEEMEEWKEVGYEPYLAFMAMEEELTYQDYINVSERRLELWQALRPVFENYDFLITPTVAVPPFELGDIGVTEIGGKSVSALGWMPFTYPFNFTGQPAASIPAGLTDNGLPVGMQIVGRHYEDAEVLKISKAYQDSNPWQDEYSSINL